MSLQIGSAIEFAEGLLALPATFSNEYQLGHGNPPLNQLAPDMEQKGMILTTLDSRDCDKIRNPTDERRILSLDLVSLLKRRCQRFGVDWHRRNPAITILVLHALRDLGRRRDNSSGVLHHGLYAAPRRSV
jgi:hypothetical protein